MRTPELWTLPLQIATPAFVGGSTPDEVAEVRVPSIRGALRTWYRLLVGPDVASGLPGAEAAALRESMLFGGAGGTWGQSVAVLSLAELAPQGYAKARLEGDGVKYLGFSLTMGQNDRCYVAPGTRFTLRAVFPQGVSDTQAELLLASLWCWVALGGLGSRSRRGFGSLEWAGKAACTDLHGRPVERGWPGWSEPPADMRGHAQWLKKGLAEVRQRVEQALEPLKRQATTAKEPLPRVLASLEKARATRDVDGAPHVVAGGDEGPAETARAIRDVDSGPAYHLGLVPKEAASAGSSRVVLWSGQGAGFASALDAANAIGMRLMEFRRERGIDRLLRGALSTLEAGGLPERAPARAAFGLPLGLQNVKKRGTRFELRPLHRVVAEGKPTQRVEGSRAASPLLIRIAPVGKHFTVVLTLLDGPWPGRDYDVREARAPHAFMPGDPGNDLPLRFLNDIPGGQEVWP